MRQTLLLCTLVLASTACAYPRRSTFAHPAPPNLVKIEDRPPGLWTIRFVDAEIPEGKAGGLPWDSDGTAPDPFIRLVVDKRVVWESPVKMNTRRPEWNLTLPRNVEVREGASFRVELWDRETPVSADPAGNVTSTGLPTTALPDALSRLTLDNLGMITLVVSAPRAFQGVGLRFEVRPDALIVLEVERYSPAGRAGLKEGDRVVGIGPERVADMSGDEATSLMSLASERGLSLSVADEKGHEREVTLDKGFIWLVM